MSGPAEGLTACLLQLSEHTARLGELDSREAGHFREVGERLAEVGERLRGLSDALTDQGQVLTGLNGLDAAVGELEARLDEVLPPQPGGPSCYRPIPAPRWWALEDRERQLAIARLEHWVRAIFRPGFGMLADGLGDCWPQHDLALYQLDMLSELWSVLYLQSQRSATALGHQAEFLTRILPAIAEQLAIETGRCEHAQVGQRRAVAS